VFSDEERPLFVDNLATVVSRGGTYFMLCVSELTQIPDYSKLKDLIPNFDKLKEGEHGPRRVTQAEIKESFQNGWRINYIRQATLEGRMELGEAHGWLSSISKE
jgi:hypothetical protein